MSWATFKRNVRLSRTKSIYFAFIINPILAGLHFWYWLIIIKKPGEFMSDSIMPCLVHLIVTVTAIPWIAADRYEAQIEKWGYRIEWTTDQFCNWGYFIVFGLGFTTWAIAHLPNPTNSFFYFAPFLGIWMLIVIFFMYPNWGYLEHPRDKLATTEPGGQRNQTA